MKLTNFLLFAMFMQVSAVNFSQNNGRLKLKAEKESVKTILKMIEEKSEFRFLFNSSNIDVERKIDIDCNTKNLEELLDLMFLKTNVKYRSFNSNYVLYIDESEINTLKLLQQPKSISGTVTDSSDASLPGVSVTLKGTTIGTITDTNGNFSFGKIPENSTLQFSFIGMKTQNVFIGNKSIINLVLEDDAIKLDEVVAIGYGTQIKRELTGSISKINSDKLTDQPVMQFAQQLQGKLAGVQIGQTSGQPGRGVDVRIRGAASLYTTSSPLYVIDGLPITGGINNINPAEIESFTVLKDASSTALYGSRAANGVILITTKHAKIGDSKVEFSSNFGMQTIPEDKLPDMMNAREFAQFMKERTEDMILYEGKGTVDPIYTDPTQYGAGTDWYHLCTQTAPIQNYSLTIQSAREKSSSTVVAGYQEQIGTIVNTGTKLLSLRLNQDISLLNDKIKLGFNVAMSYRMDHNNRLATDGLTGLFERLFEASPLIEPYDANGAYTKFTYSPGQVISINPLSTLMNSIDDYNTTRILGNAFFNYEFLPGLSLKTNLAIDKAGEKRLQFTPSIITSGIATGISSSVDNYSWTAEANLYYTKTFLKDHHIDMMIGYSAQKFDAYNNSISGTGFPSDDVPYLSAATSITAGSSNTNQFSMLSNIGRLMYNYKGKYLLTGAMRRDGSSRFGADRRYGIFPSVSGGWIVSDELFMEKLKQLNLLKIRVSYGITGNNNFPDNYASLAKLGELNYILNGTLLPGQAISTLGNSELAWERNKQFDIGFDLSIFNNRISMTYDYYHKISDGLIMDRPIPRSSGFTSLRYNVGNFEFWGHEININTINLTGNLKWNTNLNISVDRNLIKSMVTPGFLRRNNTLGTDYFRNQEGHHLGEFYGFVFEGLYKDAADLANSAKYGSASDVGTIKVKDVNNDGVIDDVNDRTFIGDPTPDFNFGISNEFKYKNFDLNIIMSGSVGGDILNSVKWSFLSNMDGSRLPLAAMSDRWRSLENPGSGVYPRTKTGTTAMGRYVNSQWIEDGTYLTAKNISLGYIFKLHNTNNILIKNLRIYASVQNAFTLTKFTGMNPEVGINGLDPLGGIGVNENAYPVPRTISFGFTATFK